MESGLPDRAKAGSSLRHWPPGTNSKTFVPSFFAIATRFHRATISAIVFASVRTTTATCSWFRLRLA